ncbi:MAG: regulatory signaling modulator protein AmpE [Steroidobacteraceae bacterium]
MNLIALVLALVIEHGLTSLLHLREPRWLDRWCDWLGRRLGAVEGVALHAALVAAVLVPVAPVAVADALLGSHLLGLLQLAFAVLVLLASFGPRDLREEVEDYLDALERGDRGAASRRATELLEADAAGRGDALREALEEAIFVQANNRVFGVVFWFVVLGPAGAWLFRVTDLMRRRAAFEAGRSDGSGTAGGYARALGQLHGLLAWLPARLAAGAYALAGSFEDAVGHWRRVVDDVGDGLHARSEDLLARVGKGALAPSLAGVAPEALDAAAAGGALRIVVRATWIWLAAVALLVLAGTAT